MKLARLLSLLLAAALQVMPLLRATLPTQAQAWAPSAWAIVLRLATASVGLLGYHTVSAATAIVPPYTVNGTVGTSVTRQLGTSGQTAHSWSTTTAPLNSSTFPLSPGLSLSRAGLISGTPTAAGTYTYSITAWENANNTGRNISTVFTFNIGGGVAPPAITSALQAQTVPVGANPNFSVTANGTGTLIYRWFFRNGLIAGATNSSLTLTNVQTTNAGFYSVVVSNTGGAVTNFALLTVVAPPAILGPVPDQIAVAGTNVTFTVNASGTSAAYSWLVGGKVVQNAAGSSLNLNSVTPDQSGAYSVIVSNIAGTASATARLLVVPPATTNVAPALAPTSQPGQFTVAFPTVAGYSYLIQYTDTLDGTNWTTLTNVAPSFTDASITLPQPIDSAQRFYRVLVGN